MEAKIFVSWTMSLFFLTVCGSTSQTIYCDSTESTTGSLGESKVEHVKKIRSPDAVFELDYGYTWDVNISTCSSQDNIKAYLKNYEGTEISCDEDRNNSLFIYKGLPGYDDFDLAVVSDTTGAEFDIAVSCLQHEKALLVTKEEVVDIFTVIFPVLMGITMILMGGCLVCLKSEDPRKSMYMATANTIFGVVFFMMGMGTFGSISRAVMLCFLCAGAGLVLYTSCMISNMGHGMGSHPDPLIDESRDESIIH